MRGGCKFVAWNWKTKGGNHRPMGGSAYQRKVVVGLSEGYTPQGDTTTTSIGGFPLV
jgi:hypothetical protein